MSFLDIMISKSGTKIWMDTTKPQTQNVMSYLRKTTHDILEQIYRSLLQEEYVALLKIKMQKKKTHLTSLIEASILRAKEIPIQILR